MPKDYATAMSTLSPSPSSTLNGISSGEGGGGGGYHHHPHLSSSKMISSLSSVAISNAHCSLGQVGGSSNGGGGGGGMGPIMEIREMSGYGGGCVPPDKYWNHPQHSHVNPCSMVVSGPSSVRHSAVYPPVFYTPPPPPPQSYPSCSSVPTGPSSVSAAPPDWNMPPSHTESSYSHFLYSQYPSHNDYTNFLALPPSSCYETDILMMGGTGLSSLSVQTSEPSVCEPQSQSLSSSLPPPGPLSLYPVYDSKSSSTKVPDPSTPSSTTDTSSSEDLDDDAEDDDDDDDRHIISIEDDENGHSLFSLCTLCRKPALAGSSSPPHSLSQPAPPSSPQLSKILGDIEDTELDISVCSGDIEIGGIEDEMMQQDAEAFHHHPSYKISVESLAQLLGVPTSKLLPEALGTNDAVLCFKCRKMVDMAESLEKQLNSVLSTLRQIIRHHDSIIQRGQETGKPKTISTVSTQTGSPDESDENDRIENNQTGKYRCILLLQGGTKSQKNPEDGTRTDGDLPQSQPEHQASSPNKFLCHECGRTFNCGRNLGKHLRRCHWTSSVDPSPNRIPCTRESCSKKCADNSKFKSHIKSHSDDKRHYCAHCLKLFSSKSNLTAHLNSGSCLETRPPPPSSVPHSQTPPNNKSNAEPRFRCENCGLTFRTELRFRKHSSNEPCLPSKLFRCEVCSKLFAKQSELRAHKSVHSGSRPYPCDICGLTFATKGNQRVHQRTHSREKRFKCGKCGKGFTRNQALQIHMSTLHKR